MFQGNKLNTLAAVQSAPHLSPCHSWCRLHPAHKLMFSLSLLTEYLWSAQAKRGEIVTFSDLLDVFQTKKEKKKRQ